MGKISQFAEDVSDVLGYGGETNEHVMRVCQQLISARLLSSAALELVDTITDPLYTSDQVDAICREAVKAHNLERMIRDVRDAEDDKLLVCSATLNRSLWGRARTWLANWFLPPIRLEGDGCGLALTGLPLDADHARDTVRLFESAGVS